MSSLPITPSSFAQPDAHSQWVLASRSQSLFSLPFRAASGSENRTSGTPSSPFYFQITCSGGRVCCLCSQQKARARFWSCWTGCWEELFLVMVVLMCRIRSEDRSELVCMKKVWADWYCLYVHTHLCLYVDRCGREYCKREEQLSRVSFKPKEYRGPVRTAKGMADNGGRKLDCELENGSEWSEMSSMRRSCLWSIFEYFEIHFLCTIKHICNVLTIAHPSLVCDNPLYNSTDTKSVYYEDT